jgi:hypothetical protein
MRRSELENYEELEIIGFDLPKETDKEVSVERLTVTIPFGTAPFAKAAMLKGYREYFLKVSGDEATMDSLKEQVENNLEVYKRKVAKARAQAIILSPSS